MFLKKSLRAYRVAFLILSLCAISGCDYLVSRSFHKALELKNCEEAKNILLRSLSKNLNDNSAKYNLVHAFVCSGDLPSAIKQIDALLKSTTGYEFELNFLKGFLSGETGEIEQALRAYQNALDIKSDTKIKQNMELLLKQERSGKSGKKSKGKGKDQKDSESGDKSEDEQQDPQKDGKDKQKEEKKDKDAKDGKSTKMTQKQIEKIMNEIDGDEKKVRSQGLKVKSKKGNESSEKEW
jgi:Ca-activated chloride channel homolog